MREPSGDEILHDLVLAVNGDHSAASQLVQRNAMSLTFELQVDAVVHEPFAIQASAQTQCAEQINGSLLEHAGAETAFDIRAVSSLDNYRVDAVMVKDVRECEAGGACPDDRDLRSLGGHA